MTNVTDVATLADRAREAGLAAPVITVIGAVAGLRERIAWFDRRPLFGKRVVVTRASAQASALTDRLRALGAEVLEMPATRIELLDDAPIRTALLARERYQWIALTSQNAVQVLWEAMRAEGLDARALAGTKLCVVGPATAEALLERGLAPDVVPERFVAEGVLEALGARGDVRGTRVLYAAAEGARDVLARGLIELGATVDVVPLYRSVPDGEGAAAIARALEDGTVDLVTFTSASAVRAFQDAVGRSAATRALAASIGPITTEAARAAGMDVLVEASESTIQSLVDAIAASTSPAMLGQPPRDAEATRGA